MLTEMDENVDLAPARTMSEQRPPWRTSMLLVDSDPKCHLPPIAQGAASAVPQTERSTVARTSRRMKPPVAARRRHNAR